MNIYGCNVYEQTSQLPPPPPPVACEPYVALEVFLIPFSKDEQASFVVCGLFPRILSMQNGYVLFHVDYYSICGGTCITLGGVPHVLHLRGASNPINQVPSIY